MATKIFCDFCGKEASHQQVDILRPGGDDGQWRLDMCNDHYNRIVKFIESLWRT